jgi:predicted nucleic acid-binding protein
LGSADQQSGPEPSSGQGHKPHLASHNDFTTEEALTEVLAYFSERGHYLRQLTTATVRSLAADPMIRIVVHSHQSFQTGLALYESRPDKGFSLTDCISMETMRQEGITEILTHDDHFKQEGFITLL